MNKTTKTKRRVFNIDNDIKKRILEDTSRYCDRCGAEYTTDNIKLLEQFESKFIIHFLCEKCNTAHVTSYLIGDNSTARKTRIKTDLSTRELKIALKLDKISSDDVLKVFRFVKGK